MQKLEEIQKLRACALVMVLLGHMPIPMPNILLHGYPGVSIFFIISGYVCAMSYLRSYNRFIDTPTPNLYASFEFLIARFFRIIPVITIWLLIYFFIAQMINAHGGSYGDIGRWIKEFKWWSTGFYNYYFRYSNMPGLFGHFWTLAVEIQFYLLVPIFFAVFRSRRLQVLASIVIILLSSTVFRLLVPVDGYIGMLTHTQLDSIFLGVLFYLCHEKLNAISGIKTPAILKYTISISLLLILFFFPVWLDVHSTSFIKYPIYTAIVGILFYLAQRDTGWIFGKTFLRKTFNELADISFSAYVCHIIFYSGLYSFFYYNYLRDAYPWLLTGLGTTLQVIFILISTYVISKLSVIFLENPYATLGSYFTQKLRKNLLENKNLEEIIVKIRKGFEKIINLKYMGAFLLLTAIVLAVWFQVVRMERKELQQELQILEDVNYEK